MNINPQNCSLTDFGWDKTAEVTMRGNYEPTRAPLRSAFDLFFLLAPGPAHCSLLVPSSTSTIKDVSSSHFLLFATKSEIKLSFHVFNKALCWISTSQKRAKLWQSSICKVRRTSFQDQNIPIVGIAEWHCWKRDAVTKKSNPDFSSNSKSVQCILAQISCTPPCAYLFIYSIHKQSKTMPIYADNLWPWAVHVYSQFT